MGSGTAQAEGTLEGVTVEPYAGWALAGTLNSTNKGTTTGYSFNGFGFGGRAKVRFMEGLFAGLDFLTLPSLGSINANGSTASVSNTKFGLVAGWVLPFFPLTVWAGYNFMDSFTTTPATVTPTTPILKYSGSSFKFGVGYNLMPYLAVNAEYQLASYGSWDYAPSLESQGIALNYKTFLLSVSAPLNFNF